MQPAPIRGAAAPQAVFPHSNSNSCMSILLLSMEQKPCEQPASMGGEGAV